MRTVTNESPIYSIPLVDIEGNDTTFYVLALDDYLPSIY